MSTGTRADQAARSLPSAARWLMVAAILFGLLATHVLGHHDTDGDHAVLPVSSVTALIASHADVQQPISPLVSAAVANPQGADMLAPAITAPPADGIGHLTALECVVVLLWLAALVVAITSTGRTPRGREPGRSPADTSPAWASALTGALAARFALCVARV